MIPDDIDELAGLFNGCSKKRKPLIELGDVLFIFVLVEFLASQIALAYVILLIINS